MSFSLPSAVVLDLVRRAFVTVVDGRGNEEQCFCPILLSSISSTGFVGVPNTTWGVLRLMVVIVLVSLGAKRFPQPGELGTSLNDFDFFHDDRPDLSIHDDDVEIWRFEGEIGVGGPA